MEHFRESNNSEENSTSAILVSYDMQSGNYVGTYEGRQVRDNFQIDFKRASMTYEQYLSAFSDELAKEINKYDYDSILEAGVGEATTFMNIVKRLKNQQCISKGFDISPSRITVAKKFLKSHNVGNSELFVGKLQKMPLADNSFDIVYTVHAIEPNSNNEKKIVEELYRVANKYLILVEPSYELGNAETKYNIDKHKYIKNLEGTIKNLGYKVLRYELFPVGTYTNQPAIFVIEKENTNEKSSVDFCCPTCKSKLDLSADNYFCSRCSLVYPVLSDIPILDSNNAVFFSMYNK